MEERNIRTAMLIGEAALDRLKGARVAVFGLGGVGGYTVEALARVGVGELLLFDNDTVSESNINRQLIATYDSVGMSKTDAFEERIKSINPLCRVKKYTLFVTPETLDGLDLDSCDYIVDAIDTVSTKIALAARAEALGVRIISSMGTGNKLDPTAFEIADIYETSVCPLARVMRTELRRRGVKHLKVLYSKEEPTKPHFTPGTNGYNGAENMTSPDPCEKKREKQPPASISFVPSVAGLIIASEVVKDIIAEKA